jgi:uncharacterized peroxidase-related enzyme
MFIDTIPPQQATGAVRDMYERQQGAFGYVPNYARAFCHRPDVMVAWAGLLSCIRRHVDRRRFELVTLTAAHALNNSCCSLAHGRALAEMLDPADVQALASGGDTSALSAAERAIVKLARQVALDASAVTAEDVEALRRHGLTEAEIFDVVAIAAARSFFTKVLDGVGTQPDSDFMRMDEDLRRALAVGRPIASEAVEQLPVDPALEQPDRA